MTVGFIGGSGIYEALPMENTSTEFVKTPFGEPSAPLTVGELAGEEVTLQEVLEGAVNTPTDAIPRDIRERVGSLIDDYL